MRLMVLAITNEQTSDHLKKKGEDIVLSAGH